MCIQKIINTWNAAKIERLLQERNRIIAEKDDGEIFIEDGQIKSASAGGGSAGAGKPSESAAAVNFLL